jgi:hypothetical protein
VPDADEGGRAHEGQHTGDRAHRPVEADLADVDDITHDADLDELHRRSDGDEDAEVEARPDLALPRR